MGIDTGVAGRSRQILILTVRDMKMGFRVTVFFGQTEVDDIHLVSALSDAHQKIIRFNVPVNERLGMNVLDPRDELVGEQEHRFQGELAITEVEEILQARPQQIEHHGIIVTLGAKPTHEGNADPARQRFVDASLIFELGVLGLDAL